MRRLRCFLTVSLFFFFIGAVAAKEVESAAIRYSESPPFVEGQRVEELWAKADGLFRFIIPAQATPAFFQSEAAILFDDENLYISIKGLHQQAVADNVERTVFGDNNFEIFLQPEVDSDKYYQIVVSAAGKIYTGQKRSRQELPGIRFTTQMEKDHWRLNVMIPLTSIQLQIPAIGEERKIRFNICRNNIFMPEDMTEVSSFAVLDSYDYHIPDVWETAILSRASGAESRQVVSDTRGIMVNLFANPDFKLAQDNRPLGWGLHGSEVSYQETAPLSGEWMVRATGNSYHFMTRGISLEPGKAYTLKIKGRRFGPEGSLGVIQMVREAGRTREGSYSAWQIPLNTEFHEFFFPLKADAGAVSLAFYRIGSRGIDRGIDLTEVYLYEGEVSAFEIRKISRAGSKKLVAGTTPLIKSSLVGIKKEKIRVLALMASLSSTREVLEIFSGLPVDLDILTTTGKNQDVYYTDYEPAQIKERLQENRYDLYIVGSRIPERVGKELATLINENIRKGAGLWLNNCQALGHFQELLKEYPAESVTDNHYLKQALPLELMLLPTATSGSKKKPMSDIREGTAGTGKGRIILSDTSVQGTQIKLKQSQETYSYATFPYDLYADAWLARMAYYAAGATNIPMEMLSIKDGKALISGRKWPADAQVVWSLIDKNGIETAKGTVLVAGTQAEIILPELTLTGYHVLTVWLQDASKRVLDYSCAVIQQEGPRISNFVDKKQYYSGDDDGHFQITVDPFKAGLNLHWALEDFSGRILEAGQLPAREKLEFSVPLRALFTNLARLWLELRHGEQTVDKQRFPVYIQDRDKARLWNDFTPSVWNAGSETSMGVCKDIDRQLESIGIRSYLLPLQGGDAVLNAGMGLGGMYLGGGDYFCALYPPVDNIRRPSLNTAAARESIAMRAENAAREQRIWGVVHTSVCDEPNLAHPSSSFEVDAHPENIQEYQKRMQQKYGSIENFNRHCDTEYRSFAELKEVLTQEARLRNNFAEFIEWRNFNTDRWIEAIRLVSDSGKKGDPGSALSLYNSFGQWALSGNDYWKLLTRGGLEFSHEYTSMVYMGNNPIYDFDEYYRSFRPDLRVWGFTGYFGSRQRAFFEPWWFALHRYGGFCWFAASSGIGAGGGGRWLNLLDVPGYGLTEDAADLKAGLEKSALLDGLGKLFLEYEWHKRDIAILYSHPSLMVSYCLSQETRGTEIHASGKLHDYFHSRHKLRYLLEELLYQYDYIAPEQISQGILNSYKVLFLPGSIALSEQTGGAIRAFVERGGKVVSDFPPGIYDELGRRRSEPASTTWPTKQLTIIGQIFNDRDPGQKQQIRLLLQEAGSQPVLECVDTERFTGREAMRFTDDQMHIYAILRNFTRGSDSEEQEFTLPTAGYLYDLRKGSCLGKTNRFRCQVPNGEAVIYGHFPYQVEALELAAPQAVQAGDNLCVAIRIKTSTGAPAGKHVFHIELLPPSGESRFFMRRNLTAPNGQLDFVFRMAYNDPPGNWRFRIKDVLSGMSREHAFVLQ